MWFDLREHQDVGAKSAKALDVGNSQVGKKYDKMETVLCPNDGQRMTRMTALGQPHEDRVDRAGLEAELPAQVVAVAPAGRVVGQREHDGDRLGRGFARTPHAPTST